jgi:hypothetical protein
MTYSPSNKIMTDLIDWALDHGYNPFSSGTSLPERRAKLYKAYTDISHNKSEINTVIDYKADRIRLEELLDKHVKSLSQAE